MRIVLASGNRDKLREVKEILAGDGCDVVAMKEIGIDPDIVEDGDSFEANSRIKALAVWNALRERGETADTIVIADDSGLEIDALGGEPGVYSARYLGEDTPYDIKCGELIRRLDGVPDERRTARFRAAITAMLEDGEVITTCGAMEGRIGYKMAGEHGFGYDPILYLPEYGATSAQIEPEEKNRISHRGRALMAMREALEGRI